MLTTFSLPRIFLFNLIVHKSCPSQLSSKSNSLGKLKKQMNLNYSDKRTLLRIGVSPSTNYTPKRFIKQAFI